MKKIFTSLLLTLLFVTASASDDTTFLQFNLTNYSDWTYHRTGVDLTKENIQRGRITLMVTEGGQLATLESPEFGCASVDSLKIWIDYRPYNTYNPDKVALQIDLLDLESQAVSTVTVPVAANNNYQELTTMLPVPADGQYTLLFSAPKADVNNHASVRAIKVWTVTATEFVRGDVNGDGSVDVADINLLINITLGKLSADAFGGRAYITEGDEQVDVADINAIINIILGK